MDLRTPILVATVVAYAGRGAAQEVPVEAVRLRIVREAEAARDAGDATRALDLATRAGQIRMSPSLRLLIAQQHGTLGHTLEALESAGRCASEARSTPALPHRERLLETCELLERSLRARVGYVVVRVPSPAPEGLRVRVGGGDLPASLWGLDVPLMPGDVSVDASGEAGSFHRDVAVRAGATETVEVALRPSPGPSLRSDASGGAPRGRRGAPLGPWFVAGGGAASLAASLVFYLVRSGALAAQGTLCPGSVCPTRADAAAAQQSHDRAVTYNGLSGVALGLGVAAVVGGALWYLQARTDAAPPRASLRWHVAPTSTGVTFGLEGAL